ncbi:12119_t:CDS:2 [Entrophospora sp. SA101]|nr:12119_t:CDS:2 [Entrophospora sp. SA101]
MERRKQKEHAAALLREEKAKELYEKINNLALSFNLKKDKNDKVFGSIRAEDILKEMKNLGFHLEKKQLLDFVSFNSLVKDMNDEFKINGEEIELKGRLKTNILSKTSSTGNVFYYVFLSDEEGKDIPLFFWLDNFPYEEQSKIEELKQDQTIIARGFYKKTGNYANPLFHVKKDLYKKLDKPLTLLEFEAISNEAKEIIPDNWQELSQDERKLAEELVITGFFKKLNLLPLFDELKKNSSIAKTYEKHKQKAIKHKQILDKLLQQEKDCEADFQTIYQQISNSQISLPEMKKLYNQMDQLFERYPNFRPGEKTDKLLEEILGEFANRLETTNEEEKKQMKSEFDQLKNTIHEEKKKRGQIISQDTSGDSSNITKKDQGTQKLSQRISELESKIKQLEQEKQQSSQQNNIELENKIKDLQSQIKILQNELEKTKKGSDSKISKGLFVGKTSSTSENTRNDKQKNEFP